MGSYRVRLFLAAMNLQVLNTYSKIFNKKLNVLLSYAYRGNAYSKFMVQDRGKIDKLILDSGAWTLNNNKVL